MALKSRTYKITQQDNTVLEFTITLDDSLANRYSAFEWDSKTGLVTALDENTQKRVIIPVTGTTTGQIQPGPFSAEGLVKIDYNLWYL
jgi:hypothetical protein